MRSYAVIGCGGIGGYYGGRLQEAGHDVHFLLRSDYAHVRKHGLIVDSRDGDFVLPQVQAYRDPKKMPRCDVVLVTIKTTENHVLPEILPHLLPRKRGVIVLMQNGLNQEEVVAKVVGRSRVMSGLCFVCSNQKGPGHIHHLDYGKVALGDYRPAGGRAGITKRLRDIAADFEAAKIPVRPDGDLWSARWRKLVWNIPFNGLSVVLKASTQQLMNNPKTEALAEALMREVVMGARASGATIPRGLVATMMGYTRAMKPYATSMLLDLKRKKPMEVEAIYGEPLRTAAKAGRRLPRVEELYQQLSYINDKLLS